MARQQIVIPGWSSTNNLNSARSQPSTYDSLNRLRTASFYGGSDQYGYDPRGNLLSKTVTSGSGEYWSQSYTATNKLSGWGYDAAGNLTNTHNGPYHNVYNAENEWTFERVNNVSYLYDGDGRRVETSGGASGNRMYWYDQHGEVLEESDDHGTLQKVYFYLNGAKLAYLQGTSSLYFYYGDHLGTTRMMTDGSGNVCYDADYFPWGDEDHVFTNTCSQNYKFTAKERDPDLGVYNMGARFYQDAMGRFYSPDPLPWLDWQHGNAAERQEFRDFLSNPQNLNLYTYVGNDPINKTDPTGMKGCAAGDKKFSSCTIKIVYDPKTSKGILTVLGQNKGDKNPTVLLTSKVVVGGDGHVTPTGTFTATVWEKDHVSTKYGSAANTPYSKTMLGGNAFGPYQLHIAELDSKGIYIHGTMGPSWSPVTWGNSIFLSPTSHGCVRMCNRDDVALHEMMPDPSGNKIVISAEPED